MPELPETVLSAYYLIVATAGIVSIFLAYWNWRRDRPIIQPIILACHHDASKPTRVTVYLEVQNLGQRPTSLNELELSVYDGSAEFHGLLVTLQDARQTAKIFRPYRPEEPPDVNVDLPLVVAAGLTKRLIASFHLDGTITRREAKCILEARYTHGKKTAECTSRSTPVHEASIRA